LNSDDGVISGTSGLKSSGGDDGVLNIQNNGTTAVTVNASGNVGIGTSSPTDRIDITRNSAVNSSGGLTLTNSSTSGYGSALNWNLALNSVAGVNGRIYCEAASSTASFMAFQTTVGSTLAERMRIDSSGNLLVGTTTTTNTVVGSRLFPTGGAHFTETTTGDGPLTQFININGTIANGYRYCSFRLNSGGTEKGTITINTGTNQVNYNQTSDRRLKTNIQPSASALGVLSQVEIVSFDMIEGGHTNFGVIAQDLEAVFPEAVSPGDSGEIVERVWGVDTSNLVPALVKAIQELSAKNDALEARIAALEQA
jgi:hypothetical protein